VNFKDRYVCSCDDVTEAIKKRRQIEQQHSVKIMEGETKVYYGGPFGLRVTKTEDGKLWFFAGDLCTSIGYAYTTYGKYTELIPDHMQGLVHLNHGKRAYRVYSLEGALTFLSYVKKADIKPFKKWLMLYVYPATVMSKDKRLTMAHYVLSSVVGN